MCNIYRMSLCRWLSALLDNLNHNRCPSTAARSHNLQKWKDDWLMAFNPDKCEILRMTNKQKITPATYTICGHQLKQVESARYLGVDIDSRLTFNRHTDHIPKQANGAKSFLQHNTNSFPCKIKDSCYTTFVCPQLEYASTVWSPHTQRNINKVKVVHRRSARYVRKDYIMYNSVTTILQELELHTLEQRWSQARLTMFFKVVHGHIDIPADIWSQCQWPPGITRWGTCSHVFTYWATSTFSSQQQQQHGTNSAMQ